MKIIRLLIADDHTIFRQGLVSLLEIEPEIHIVGEARNGKEVLQMAASSTLDIVLMDIEMPGKNGVDTTNELRKNFPEVKVLALTMYNNPAFIRQMLKAGASGYVLKDVGKQELLLAIKTVDGGGQYHSKLVTDNIMNSLQRKAKKSGPLSNRELQIVQLISDQLTTGEIAEKLHISTLTVETHRKNIYLKLDVHNAAGLVKLALKKGWIQ